MKPGPAPRNMRSLEQLLAIKRARQRMMRARPVWTRSAIPSNFADQALELMGKSEDALSRTAPCSNWLA